MADEPKVVVKVSGSMTVTSSDGKAVIIQQRQ